MRSPTARTRRWGRSFSSSTELRRDDASLVTTRAWLVTTRASLVTTRASLVTTRAPLVTSCAVMSVAVIALA